MTTRHITLPSTLHAATLAATRHHPCAYFTMYFTMYHTLCTLYYVLYYALYDVLYYVLYYALTMSYTMSYTMSHTMHHVMAAPACVPRWAMDITCNGNVTAMDISPLLPAPEHAPHRVLAAWHSLHLPLLPACLLACLRALGGPAATLPLHYR